MNPQSLRKRLLKNWVFRLGTPWPVRIADGLYPYIIDRAPYKIGKRYSFAVEMRMAAVPRLEKGNMHHPELVNGANVEVIAAGMVEIKDRQIAKITNQSGHYCPDADSVRYALTAMHYLSIPITPDRELDDAWECN